MEYNFNLTMIRELRQKYHLKQYDMCRYIGVSDVAYRTWELKVRKPNDEHLGVLKAIFKTLREHEGDIPDRETALNILDEELILDA